MRAEGREPPRLAPAKGRHHCTVGDSPGFRIIWWNEHSRGGSGKPAARRRLRYRLLLQPVEGATLLDPLAPGGPCSDERRVGAVRLWRPVRDVARLITGSKRDPEQMLDLECHVAWSTSPPSPSSASA